MRLLLSFLGGSFLSLVHAIVSLFFMLFFAALIIFFVLEILPGDPAATMLGVSATPENMAALKRDLGLDAPAWQRFFSWIFGFFRGDLGLSYAYRVPVVDLIAARLPLTLPLALFALSLALLIGLPLGFWAALRQKTKTDFWLMAGAQIGISIPNFWFGILFIRFFAIDRPIFPSGGFAGWQAGFWAGFVALFLPALSLALPQASVLARMMRASLLETTGQDYIRTARAKGLSLRRVLFRHALPNAFLPILTMIAMQFSFLLMGSIVVENVFALPGLGRLLVQAIGGHDLVLLRSLVLIFVAFGLVVSSLVEWLYGWLDPRLRPPLAQSRQAS